MFPSGFSLCDKCCNLFFSSCFQLHYPSVLTLSRRSPKSYKSHFIYTEFSSKLARLLVFDVLQPIQQRAATYNRIKSFSLASTVLSHLFHFAGTGICQTSGFTCESRPLSKFLCRQCTFAVCEHSRDLRFIYSIGFYGFSGYNHKMIIQFRNQKHLLSMIICIITEYTTPHFPCILCIHVFQISMCRNVYVKTKPEKFF